MNVGEEKVEFARRDVLSAPIPNESMYLIDIFDDIPLTSKWDLKVDALQSFLEETGGEIMQRYWDGKTLLRVIMLLILSCLIRFCRYVKSSRH